MRLDRNEHPSGRGKYALLKLRRLDTYTDPSDQFASVAKPIADAIKVLEDAGIIDWGIAGTESEFMVLRLKDKWAQGPLCEYANAAERDGEWEYAKDIREMASRSGPASPWCKKPD